jgi:hypothetical protein
MRMEATETETANKLRNAITRRDALDWSISPLYVSKTFDV